MSDQTPTPLDIAIIERDVALSEVERLLDVYLRHQTIIENGEVGVNIRSVIQENCELIEEVATLRKLAGDLLETVYWMSGSNDFGPEGQAFEGWKKAQSLLDHARELLAGHGDTGA